MTEPTDLRSRRDSDAEVAARAATGDARAFERLYRAHAARVHSLARRMLRDDEADEATQDVFVRAWQKLGTFRGQAAFGTWLHRLAVNVLLSRRATRGLRERRQADDAAPLEHAAGPPATPELRLDVDDALARLPDGMRRVLVLHDIEGFRHEEIAAALGIAVGTSKSQLHRARMAMRSLLER